VQQDKTVGGDEKAMVRRPVERGKSPSEGGAEEDTQIQDEITRRMPGERKVGERGGRSKGPKGETEKGTESG